MEFDGFSARAGQRSYRHLVVQSPQTIRHLVSLGPRCTNASSVYKAQRCYAGPFDWIFSSPRMVLDCIRDDFASFLDRSAYYEVTRSFDAIGLPPGAAPRERVLVGHHRYSEMTEGVGRGVIFNHHNPLEEEGHAYLLRCVERFRLVLRNEEAKLFSLINIDKKLWMPDGLRLLFDELASSCSGRFVLLALNCVKHQGQAAVGIEPMQLEHRESHSGILQILEVACIGDNSGSYFKDEFDARRVQAIMVDPFRFDLAPDPLKSQPVLAAGTPSPGTSRWRRGRQDCGEADKKGSDPADVLASSVTPPSATGSMHQLASESTTAMQSRWGKRAVQQQVEPAQKVLSDTITLRNGQQMPRLGLGTWQASSGGECLQAVHAALANGCHLVDTAAAYKNEEDVGKALKTVSRNSVFLVTKLQSREHGNRVKVLAALRASLARLGVEYVDLYLMHSPSGGDVLETWDALCHARDLGLAKSVGVSNFSIAQLEGLLAAGRELPEVNQIELHPWLQQRRTTEWCDAHGVAVMAYSPLGRPRARLTEKR
eukprot:TRINITY_DN12673_c0_g1_i1.p1 TRINITY_DN12673_c0_g1~~TRINITY_DN12673_c0_g1_i1.p1  ORF type:complete len:541 (-),score=69.04 TRINITY_DN12673_c0_g1_i1:70-1692(-)